MRSVDSVEFCRRTYWMQIESWKWRLRRPSGVCGFLQAFQSFTYK